MSKFVSISVAATALGVSTSTLRRWNATGRLPPATTARSAVKDARC
jgi:DNA-binding transcriptional MerR regulator